MNIYDVYMDGEEAVISATHHEVDFDDRLIFLVRRDDEDEEIKIFDVVAMFQPDVWKWFEKRQVEEK